MSQLRVPVSLQGAGPMGLDEDSTHYVTRVHRLGPGATFVVFDPEGGVEADARLVEVGKRSALCEVSEVRASRHVASRTLWLLQGMCKGLKLDGVVREATALGATDIVPMRLERSIVRDLDDTAHRTDRWHRIAVESARQCGRGDIPTIHRAASLQEALELLPADSMRLCFWEEATRPAREGLRELEPSRAVVVLVGPEGGLEVSEVELCERNGFDIVSMGPFVLRAETAATVALSFVLGA